MYSNVSRLAIIFAIGCGLLMVEGGSSKYRPNFNPAGFAGHKKPPNILLVVMDDVGIDQFKLFGYGGLNPINQIKTPTMDALAAGGIKFHNAWSAPDCSPARTSLLTGRYSIRTNVTTAILPPDLAGNQIYPYERTIPSILRSHAAYESILIGKAHYANTPPSNYNTTPYGGTSMTHVGFDRFEGWFGGAPLSIDTTAGGIAAVGTYSCGYVPSLAINGSTGADFGACYFVDGSCRNMTLNATIQSPGMECVINGGILVPNAACTSPPPSQLKFSNDNGYYAGEYISIPRRRSPYQGYPPEDPSGFGRGYRTTIEADRCIDWIKSRSGDRPWFAKLSFSSAHTPIHPPPLNLVYSQAIAATSVAQICDGGAVNTYAIFNAMVEALDKELGRVLVETGIATWNADGSINYDPQASNTMVIVLSDNGSFGPTVKLPFDPYLAKAYVYQTGVWVPLIVSGPLVVGPNRQVDAMVNTLDLFQLFGEIAGVDVRKAVPKVRALDSKPLMPYLKNDSQAPIRSNNFAYTAAAYRGANYLNQACVVESINACTTLFFAEFLCNDEGGIWYGKGGAGPPEGFESCCELNRWMQEVKGEPPFSILPDSQTAIRNAQYKYLTYNYIDWVNGSCNEIVIEQFFQINESVPFPRIDRPVDNLLQDGVVLTPEEQSNLSSLKTQLNETLSSAIPCPGDVNMDGRVNFLDLIQQHRWIHITDGKSTWYDMNLDGVTNKTDVMLLKARIGTKCVLPR